MKSALRGFLRRLYKRGLHQQTIPDVGEVILGDLNRTLPFSEEFGYDRGGPIDRYYIENFLQRNERLIRGRVLEIRDNEYTLRFGKTNVVQSDVFDKDAENTAATIIGDLTSVPDLADNTFDCIILTQTLHMIYNYRDALFTCFRILKPNGSLLLTVPGITNIDYNDPKNAWMFSFTSHSIERALTEFFPQDKFQVETFGNVLTATAFLYGMGLPEIPKHQLDFIDPYYQVIICAIATKPA